MNLRLLTLAGGLLLSSTCFGQWVQQPFTFASAENVALTTDAIDINTAWALSSGYFSELNVNEVARTTNGGLQWQVLPIPAIDTNNETITSLSAVNATTAWVVTVSRTSGRVLKTTDGGATWTVQSTATMFAAPASYPNTIHFFNLNDGVVIGDPDGENGGGMEIYYTSNGGTTWTRAANVPVGTDGEWGTISPPAVAGNSIWFANDEGDIFRSTDKGVTWSVARDVADSALEGVAFRDAQHGLALLSSGTSTQHQLFRSTDGGATWAPLPYTGPLRGVGLDNVPGTPNYLSVGVDPTSGDIGSAYSQDGGQTWINIESKTAHLFVDAASPTAVWSGAVDVLTGEGIGVNKLTSTVLPTRPATQVAGATVLPNPSPDGRLQVQWPQASHRGLLTITVTDALGRAVGHPRQVAAQSLQTDLDLSQQPAGLYYLTLASEAGVSHLRAQVR